MASIPGVTLGSCHKAMPVIGMGTASPPPMDHEIAKAAILEAIRAGYRHFDTAFAYGSERPLGEAVAEALSLGLVKSRDELFITTKLWCTFAEKDSVVPAVKMSLSNLQMEYVDLYLIHFPLRVSKEASVFPALKEHIFALDIKSVWEGMEECHNLGLAKAIGVSNFSTKKLDVLLSSARIPPAVNQVIHRAVHHMRTWAVLQTPYIRRVLESTCGTMEAVLRAFFARQFGWQSALRLMDA